MYRRYASTSFPTRLLLMGAAAVSAALLTAPSPAWAEEPPSQPVHADLDDDGVLDEIVAEPCESGDEPGRLLIVSGETGEPLGTLQGRESGDQFGYSVSVRCDVNQDGVRDLIAGAPKEADGEGRAYIFLGPIEDEELLTPDDAYLTLQSPDQDTYDFGKRVECLEDLDDDGKPDVLVEASFTDQSQNEATRTFIFSGYTGALIETLGAAQGGGGQIAEWNVDDLLMVINFWNTEDGDITGDGETNVDDLLYVINHWGQDKFPFYVNPPVNPTTIPLTNGYLQLLNNITDGVRFDTAVVGTVNGIHQANLLTSTRIYTRGYEATGVSEYGLFLSEGYDHFHERLVLHQGASNASQALLRVNGGNRFLLHMATLDSTLGTNDSCRFWGVQNTAVVHSKIKGGIYQIGVPGPNLGQYSSLLMDHWVWNVTFDYGRDQTYSAAFNINYRVHKVVLDDVRVTTPFTNNKFADVSDPAPNTQDPHPIVEIRNCTLNGDPVTYDDIGGNLTNVIIIND